MPTIDPGAERRRQPPNRGGPRDTAEPEGQFPDREDHPDKPEEGHEGAKEEEVGDRGGPGTGYDQEPVQEPGQGGVA